MVFFHFAELNAFIIFRIAIAQHLSSIATLDRLVYILTALKFDLALRNRNCLSFSAKEIGSKSLLMVLIRRRSIWWLSYFGMMTSFYSFHFSRKSPSLRHVIKAEAKWCTHCYFQSDIRDSSWSRGLFFIEFIKLNKIKTCASTTAIQYILQQFATSSQWGALAFYWCHHRPVWAIPSIRIWFDTSHEMFGFALRDSRLQFFHRVFVLHMALLKSVSVSSILQV